MRFAGQWKDMGTWNTLTEAMEEPSIGKAMLNDTCQNVHVLNELDVPVLCMGLKDVVVSASPEGILVSDKEQSSYIKPYVDSIHQQIMFAEKSWGSFRVLDVEDASMTIKITLTPGHGMNYHSHENRDEVWTVHLRYRPCDSGRRASRREGRGYPDDARRLPPHSLCRQRAENHRGSARSGHQRGG